MTMPESARTLTEDLLARAAEDWVSAAEVIDLVRRSGATDPETLRDLSMGLVSRLLLQGLIVAGDLDGQSHVPWPCSPLDSIGRIITAWAAKRDPFVMPGEVVWINTTPAGQRIGEAIWRREEP
ncbi:hypothetical protein [Sinomonas sp. G460-2]|uniref:hypothetical protein n=1 Tax=Sinomonas sp. G460-2 TaxID=3393464 RepID=UPI0039EFC796